MLSLPLNIISDLILVGECPCERQQYGRPHYIQYGACLHQMHVCVSQACKEKEITCHYCKKDVGCDRDMILIPPNA